ncbi:hypothetical protein, partial [Roseibacillus persicicus]|uniref:hypothetical protein n=1 Tax=Roseibacillus persicicus TaxID=454148 RepID=UPI0035ECF525
RTRRPRKTSLQSIRHRELAIQNNAKSAMLTLDNVLAHPIRPTQRTFTGSITFLPPVNLRLASAVGFVVLRIVRYLFRSEASTLAMPGIPLRLSL